MVQDLSTCEERGKPANAFAQHLAAQDSSVECQRCKVLEESNDYLWDKIQKCLHILHDMDNPHGSYRRDSSEFVKSINEHLLQS